MMNAVAEGERRQRPWVRWALLLGAIGALNVLGGWLVAQIEFTLTPINSDMVYSLLMAIAAVYIVVIALPFVPGIEIGLMLLFVLGPAGVPLVYTCNLIALALAYLVGRLIPLRITAGLFGWLRMERAQRLVTAMDGCPAAQRLDVAIERLPRGWTRRLLSHRHLTAAIVLNMPGNAAIGGAGGIAMIAGMSRLFRFPLFVLTMAIASTPVPIVILLTR